MRKSTAALWLWAVAVTVALFKKKKRPHYDVKNVAHCEKCRKLLGLRAGLRILEHLIDEHGCDPISAEETLKFCQERLLKCLQRKQH